LESFILINISVTDINLNIDFLVIDNFYSNPYDVRNMVLQGEFLLPGYSAGYPNGDGPFSGKHSIKPYLPKNLDSKISKFLNRRLSHAGIKDHGYFRITTSQDKVKTDVHADATIEENSPITYAGVLYLGLDEHHDEIPGTQLLKHKITKDEYLKNDLHYQVLDNLGAFSDIDQWEVAATASYKFNRLIIYPASKFHRPGPAYGFTDENSRMVQLFGWKEIVY
jgi:hypothetical protein